SQSITVDVSMQPGTGQLGGTVQGPGNVPLGGATITITNGTTTLSTTSQTVAPVGHWSINGVSTPGTYLITTTLSGYGTQTSVVSLVAQGANLDIAIPMTPGVGSLTGTISTAGGPVGGATITVTGPNITKSATTLTVTPVGTYSVPALPIPGTYTVAL